MATKRPDPTTPTRPDDVVLVHGRSEDGKTLAVVRKKGDALSAGLLRAAEEGKPLTGDLLRLRPREGMPLVCDVDVLHEVPAAQGADRDGPAQVATPAYREGWDAIWGAPTSKKARGPSSMLN